MSFNWDPKSVPSQLVPYLDQLVYGLQKGTIYLRSLNQTRNMGGMSEWVIELVDPTASPGVAAPMIAPMFSIASTAPVLPPRKIVEDLGVGKEPIIGFRDFDIEHTDEGFLLMSRNGTPWWPRQKLRATCGGKLFSEHDAPKEGCQCGIYAYAAPNNPNLKDRNVVWGEIAMWGDVLICETGYRAEFAYPLSLFVRDVGTKVVKFLRDSLEESYGVPVFMVEERDGKTAAEIMGEMVQSMLRDVDE